VLSTAVLPDEWRRLVIERLAPFGPEKIIIFGSRARGEARPDSDVDLLVVFDGVEDGRDLEVELLGALASVPFAKDVIVATSELLSRRGDAVGTVYRRALREGMVIYGVDDRDAQTWLRYAEEDLQMAERTAEGRGFAPRWACFLAQQAAEKALKGMLIAHRIDFPPTHDLERLQDLAPSGRVTKLDVDLRRLSRWSTRGRYPGDWGEATQADAREAIAAARALVDAAREDIVS
jgi:HEPN domain-containing protein/predicted nucleotidyltransferase